MEILKLNIPVGFYIWLYVCKSTEGSVLDCSVDCACCIDGKCAPGKWFPDECTLGCIDGYRGARCYTKCSLNCRRCDIADSKNCTACYDGYYPGPLFDCTSECLPGCKTCRSGSSCTSCKEDYYNDNGSNDCRYYTCPENCKCVNNRCTSCKDGYYNTSNSCNSLCPGNCVTCSSGTNCGSCKDGYYNGYLNDDSSLSLLNDCTYACREECVKCSHYGVCSMCKPGLYGPICNKTCLAGCVTGTCDIQTGNCDCSPNFVGDKCDTCQSGKYGDMCDKQCSLGCKENECEKVSGDCIHGCIFESIVGDKCDVCSKDSSSDQSNSVVFIALGIILAASLVANIILVVIFVVPKLRQRINTNKKSKESKDVCAVRIKASEIDNIEMAGVCNVDNYENPKKGQGLEDVYDDIQEKA